MLRLLPLALMLSALLSAPVRTAAQTQETVVYLVRHGEVDADGTRDPSLDAAGRARALVLAHTLADAGITAIHSTELHRTQQTGGPISRATGHPIQSYDPSDLDGFAAWLRARPGRHLVLGHSNTTPALVTALGGEPGPPIDEFEFDRLYVLTFTADGVGTVLLRYGAPFPG